MNAMLRVVPQLRCWSHRGVRGLRLQQGQRCHMLHQRVGMATVGATIMHSASHDAATEAVRRIRNVSIVAHIDAGKTTTTERMLYYAGVVKRVGEVDSGTTTTDFMKEEMERGITIQSAAVALHWRDHAISLIDTPGHVDFTVEVERAMRVVDGVVALFDASAGVQAQSYTVLQQSRKFDVPVVGFMNKMDKFNADLDKAIASIRTKLNLEPVLLQLPLHTADGSFEGVIDLLTMTAYRFAGTHGETMQAQPLQPQSATGGTSVAASSAPPGVPAVEETHVQRQACAARHRLISQLTAQDDTLAEALIALLDCTNDETAAEAQLPASALRDAVRRLLRLQWRAGDDAAGERTTQRLGIMPVLCGAARRDQGVQPLLDAIVDYLPSPLERTVTGLSRHNVTTALPPAHYDATTPLYALAFKVMHTTAPSGRREPLVFLRVYSGQLTPRMTVQNHSRRRSEVVERLYVMQANVPVEVPRLHAGQIGAAFLKYATTGDTLFAPPQARPPVSAATAESTSSDAATSSEPVYTLEGIDAPPAVISFSIEAGSGRDVAQLQSALDELSREDPSLRVSQDDFGNVVVSGMGELHLEIVLSRLQNEYQVRCRLLRAIIQYRETIRSVWAVDKDVGRYMELPYIEYALELRPRRRDEAGAEETCAATEGCSFALDPALRTRLLGGAERDRRAQDSRRSEAELRVVQDSFSAAVETCARLGPLAGLPLHGVQVVLTEFRKIGSAEVQERTLTQVARAVVLAAFKSIPQTEMALLEPMMEVEVHLSEAAYIGSVVRSLNEHKAISVDVLEDGQSVRAVVALRNIVRYTMELRKAVKGHANLFTRLHHYRVIEDKAVASRVLHNLGVG